MVFILKALLKLIPLCCIIFPSCETQTKQNTGFNVDLIINNCRQVYGSDLINTSHISFRFREYRYSWTFKDGKREQVRATIDSAGNQITDYWIGEDFYRLINQDTLDLSKNWIKKYKNSINAVFYFAFLPKALTDEAVQATLIGEVKLKQEPYYKIKVTFSEEGGGDDYQDIFIYWIHKEKFKLDYLAYQYFTKGGGMRFRAVKNHHKIGDLIFQDYLNYKPQNSFNNIYSLDSLYEKNELQLISEINLEELNVIPTKN